MRLLLHLRQASSQVCKDCFPSQTFHRKAARKILHSERSPPSRHSFPTLRKDRSPARLPKVLHSARLYRSRVLVRDRVNFRRVVSKFRGFLRRRVEIGFQRCPIAFRAARPVQHERRVAFQSACDRIGHIPVTAKNTMFTENLNRKSKSKSNCSYKTENLRKN